MSSANRPASETSLMVLPCQCGDEHCEDLIFVISNPHILEVKDPNVPEGTLVPAGNLAMDQVEELAKSLLLAVERHRQGVPKHALFGELREERG